MASLDALINQSYRTKETGRSTILSGASGDLATITPASNEKVIVTSLITATNPESNITLSVGARGVIDNESIGSVNTTGFTGYRGPAYGGRGEEVVLTKTTGTTSNDITIIWQILEPDV